MNMSKFEEACEKKHKENPDKDLKTIEDELRKEMTDRFEGITPEQGRELVKNAGVLVLPEWDIANAIVLDVVTKQTTPVYKTKEEA